MRVILQGVYSRRINIQHSIHAFSDWFIPLIGSTLQTEIVLKKNFDKEWKKTINSDLVECP